MKRAVGDQDDQVDLLVLRDLAQDPQGRVGHVGVPVVVHHPVLHHVVTWKEKGSQATALFIILSRSLPRLTPAEQQRRFFNVGLEPTTSNECKFIRSHSCCR